MSLCERLYGNRVWDEARRDRAWDGKEGAIGGWDEARRDRGFLG